VAVKGVNGRMDIEVRYTLERGVSGFYTYAITPTGRIIPLAGEGESRSSTSSQPTSTGSPSIPTAICRCAACHERGGVVITRRTAHPQLRHLPKFRRAQIQLCARMYELPAYGWSSIKVTRASVYQPLERIPRRRPTRIDLVCPMGATMLDYWTSGHYAGGAECNILGWRSWNKVVGPIFVYYNTIPFSPSSFFPFSSLRRGT